MSDRRTAPPPDDAQPGRFLRRERNRILRRTRLRRRLRRGAGGTLLAGAVLIGLLWLAGAVGGWLRSSPLLAVRAVAVEGTVRAPRVEIERILASNLGHNILALDLAAVRASVEAHPWVAAARLRRALPATLAAIVEEKVPAAVAVLDGRPTLVTADGEAIVPWPATAGTLDRVLITGVDEAGGSNRQRRAAAVRDGLAAVRALEERGGSLPGRIAEIDVSRPDRFTLRLLDEPAPLLLSRAEPLRNLDHYFAVRVDLHQRIRQVAAIDLRWRDRVTIVPAAPPAPGAAPSPGAVATPAVSGGRPPEEKTPRHG